MDYQTFQPHPDLASLLSCAPRPKSRHFYSHAEADGVTIYLNGGDNLQVILDRVVKNNGKTIIPKTAHADDIGYFAIFLDSEGNRIGLHSPN